MDIKLGIELYNQGNFLEAEKLFLKVLDKDPNNAYINNILALLYNQIGEYAMAEKYAQIAVNLEENVDYMENLAICYYLQNKFEKAMPIFEQILEKTPKDLDRIRDYAKFAKDTKQWEYAINFYLKSLALDKRDYVAMNNIGLGLEEQRQFEKAKSYYESSIRVKPNYWAYHNLGVYYRRARDFQKSVVFLKRALQYQPENIETMTSLGMSYLSMKDFENGYKYYQHRCPELKKKFANPWDGSEHKDSTLLVYFDGGRGDLLMFCRYLNFVKDKFKKIIFATFDEMVDFFKLNFPDLQVCSINSPFSYDYSVNIMELHYVLGIDFENIPYSNGYLKADEKKVIEYKEKYFQNDKLKIGLFWQGNLKVFPYRSMTLKEMSPLFNINNAQFYSCQKGAGIEQLEDFNNVNIIDLGSTFNNYSDTAAALKNLDFLITIDSSILHMAGALAVKTILLLPHASEWRWFDDTITTPWYDSVKLFKQAKLYDWSIPINNVLKELNN